VRKTAQGLKLRTEASTRFEQGLSPELAGYGMRAAVDMILELAGGELEGFVDMYPEPQKETQVAVSLEKVNAVLGTSLTEAEVTDVFTCLGLIFDLRNPNIWEVRAPFERLDLQTAEDLVEEVGRIIGYDHVPAAALPAFNMLSKVTKSFAAGEAAREALLAQGYSEVYTSVFAEAGERAVLNKVDSVKPFLRASLLPGLQEALERNKQSKDLLGLTEVKLFEVGPVWKEGKELTMVGTVSEKEKAKEAPLEADESKEYQQLPLSAATRYEPFSRFPYIVRDIAFWISVRPTRSNMEDEVLDMIKKEAGELAHKIWLFDRFEKEGKVSLAYRLIFQSFKRTLTEVEVNQVMEKVSKALQAKGFEVR
jgi:phenylalanyl-tRNA synthetase beta subunit